MNELMEWYEEEVRYLEATRVAPIRKERAVVFYGSSTIRLWENLARDLRDSRALNLGFGGSTLEACEYFFERLVTPVKPCSLVLYAGDNDLGDGRSPGDVLASFRKLTDKVDRDLAGADFAFISIKPSPARFGILDKIRLANKLIREEIRAHPQAYYIDVFNGMLDGDGKPRWELFTDDGLHMSPAGYQLWVKLLSPYRHRMFTSDCCPIQEKSLPLN